MKLAILGGAPVRTSGRSWPRWPRVSETGIARVVDTLRGGRWAVSGAYMGVPARERQFADAFARYLGAEHVLPCASGSAALRLALEALDVGYDDEVIVPGFTWVATASSVLAVNAVPVLVDVDPATYCIDPTSVESAITSRTRAVIAVHLYSAVAALAELKSLCWSRGLALIEDCAHAHGARMDGRSVGTWGDAGAFSMQQTKLLTSGEGGAVVVQRPELYRRAQQLRTDGRIYAAEPKTGELEILAAGELMGANRCLSEVQAALLLDGLETIAAEQEVRCWSAQYLDAALREIGAFTPQQTDRRTDRRAYYRYAFALDDDAFRDLETQVVADALSAELGFSVERSYEPLNRNVQYAPSTLRRLDLGQHFCARVDPRRYELPVSAALFRRVLTVPHQILLSERADLDEIAMAMAKVVEHRAELAGVAPRRRAS